MIFKAITAVFLAALLSFGAGYYKGGSDNQRQAEADKTASLQRLIDQSAALEAENNEITSAWLAQESQIKTQTEYVEREVIKYVPAIQQQASVCNITLGTECLLNARRSGLLPAAECRSITVSAGRATSPVTTAGLIKADTECAGKYASLTNRHKALAAIVINYQQRIASMRRGDDG